MSENVSRRKFLNAGAGLVLGSSFLAACGGSKGGGSTAGGSTTTGRGSGKVVIGAFQDGGLTPFKEKIVPLFERQTGIKIELLEDAYDSVYDKFVQDAQNNAGQYDVMVLDDPWLPQFAAGDWIEDLGAGGLADDERFLPAYDALAYWPPKEGPRLKEFRTAKPKLIAFPFIGDLQTMTYRTDVFEQPPATWDELVSASKEAQADGKIDYGYVFRGIAGNPVVTAWYPVFLSFGGRFFDDQFRPAFNDAAGKAAAKFFLGPLRSIAPPGVVEYDTDQTTAALLGGKVAAAILYSGSATKASDPAESKVVGKIGHSIVPKQVASIAQIGIFIGAIPKGAPNKQNALRFAKWFTEKETQIALARAGALPVSRAAYEDPAAQKANRLMAPALAQLDAGAQARPRTPDWALVEKVLGEELNKALQARSDGAAELDRAAKRVTAELGKLGYYS